MAWQFERKGLILVPAEEAEEDDLMLTVLDAGADDLVADGDWWRVITEPGGLNDVREALSDAGIAFDSADLTMIPTSTVDMSDSGAARRVLTLVDLLDDLDDVQDVHANFDIHDDLLEQLAR